MCILVEEKLLQLVSGQLAVRRLMSGQLTGGHLTMHNWRGAIDFLNVAQIVQDSFKNS